MRQWGSWEIDEDIKAIIGYVGTVITILLFLAPVKTFIRISKDRSTTEFSSFPYLSTYVNCWLWVLYAFFTGGVVASLVTNGAGAGLSIIYLLVFLYYSAGDRSVLCAQVVVGTGFLLSSVGIVLLYEQDDYFQGQKLSTFYYGLMAGTASICMYGSPLVILRQVIQRKSSEYLPILVCMTGLFASSSWVAFGVYIGDLFITVPNSCGAFLGVIQIFVWWLYSKPPKDPFDIGSDSQDGFMRKSVKAKTSLQAPDDDDYDGFVVRPSQ